MNIVIANIELVSGQYTSAVLAVPTTRYNEKVYACLTKRVNATCVDAFSHNVTALQDTLLARHLL